MIKKIGLATLTAISVVGCVDQFQTSRYDNHSDTSVYYPAGKTEFAFIHKDDGENYTGFCQKPDRSTCEPLPYSVYEGQRGYFVDDTTSQRDEFLKVHLQRGEILFFTGSKENDPFGNRTQIQSIQEYRSIEKAKRDAQLDKIKQEHAKRRQEERFADILAAKEKEKSEFDAKYGIEPEPLVPGSKIMLVAKADINRSLDGYQLSNGEKHFKNHIKKVRAIAKNMGNNVAIAEHLLNAGYIKYDEFDDRYYLKPYNSGKSHFRLGFTVKGSTAYPTLYVKYHGENWIFAEYYILKADEQKWTYPAESFNHKNTAWTVTEWSQRMANSSDIYRVKALADAQKASVKIAGKYESTFDIHDEMAEGLRWSLMFYDLTR